MRKLDMSMDDIKDYISPKKYFVAKKKRCNWGVVAVCVLVTVVLVGAVLLALKYKRDYDMFDDYDEDFGMDDDVLYAKESDFDE
ncbi:MAG: hypothetical protein FWG63_03050 [Defluviitaleaceae bacterium]|nr:hypothetical protein [Defluviitaleaceae bacterium]